MRPVLAWWLVLALLSMTLTGCWDLRPIEDLSMFLSLGFDLAPNGVDLLITGTEPTFGMISSSPVNVVWTVAGDLSHGLRMLQTQAERITVAGKVIVYVFGESLWRSGRLTEIARQAYVRPDLSLTGFVVCVQGSASELLSLRPPDQNLIGPAIWARVAKLQREGLAPRVSLLHIVRLGEHQKDMWIPLLKPVKEINTFLHAGSVTFSRGRPAVVLDVRDTADLTSLAGLAPFNHPGSRQEGREYTSGAFSSAKMKLKRHEGPDGTLVLDVSTDFGLRLSSPVDFTTGASIDARQKAGIIEAEITGRGQTILDRLREADSDPLGLAVASPFAGIPKARQLRDKYAMSIINYRAKVRVAGLGSI
jgi:hypothetical protein